MSSANVELVREGFAAALRGDFTAVARMLDPEVRWHGGDPATGCQNREQALTWMRRAAGRGPVRLLDVADAGGDQVVVVLQPRSGPGGDPPPPGAGRDRPPLGVGGDPPPPGAGGHPRPPRANLTTVRNGRVVEMVACATPEEAWARAASHGGADAGPSRR